MDIRKIIGIALLVLIAIFVALNLDSARVWFFGARLEMPIALVVLVSAALGMGAGLLLAYVRKSGKAKATAKQD